MKLQAVISLASYFYQIQSLCFSAPLIMNISIIARSCMMVHPRIIVISCLDPNRSLFPVPSMNHIVINLLSDLLQLTKSDKPMVAAAYNYGMHIVKQ